MRVAFLLPHLGLAGGVGIVVEHAAQLNRHHGFDCRLVLPDDVADGRHWAYRGLADVPVLALSAAEAEADAHPYDVAVATWWETALDVWRLDAARHAHFIQLLEDSMYPRDVTERMSATLAMALPFRYITAARWIRRTVESWQPGNRAFYVRSGIAKDVFASPERVRPHLRGPLKIVIEGSRALPLKGVDQAVEAARLAEREHEVTLVTSYRGEGELAGVDRILTGISHREMAELLREHHVMLKLSRIEGMYGPPLEAFHMGATVVTTPVTGHDDYIRHRWNGLVVGWDDLHGTARALDLLASDRLRLHALREAALETARRWPTWEQASQFMALTLQAIRREPPPPARPAAMRLVSDLASNQLERELDARERHLLAGRYRGLAAQRSVQVALQARERLARARAAQARIRTRLGRRP